jgi:hypothetical protein
VSPLRGRVFPAQKGFGDTGDTFCTEPHHRTILGGRLFTMGQLNHPLTWTVTVRSGYLDTYSAYVAQSPAALAARVLAVRIGSGWTVASDWSPLDSTARW